MSDTVKPVELEGQHVELLPARIVLSMFSQGSDGGVAGNGTDGTGTFGVTMLGRDLLGNGGGNGIGMPGSSANGQ